MNRSFILAMGLAVGLVQSAPAAAPPEGTPAVTWHQLPPLPDPIGFAGAFAGTSNGALIVGGGANFPGGSNWDGFPKVWYDKLFILTDRDGSWNAGPEGEPFKLPRPLGYGVSATWTNPKTNESMVICLGGGDKEKHYADVFALRWTGDTIEREELPPMPGPIAFGAGVLLDNTIYMAGGMDRPNAAEALAVFWALDLAKSKEKRAWKELPTWPSPARMLPVMAAQNDKVYLFAGAELYEVAGRTNEDGTPKVTRRFLTDCYRFDPKAEKWTPIADSPEPICAAPNPGMALGPWNIVLLSGADGSNFDRAAELKDDHRGFPAVVYSYHTVLDQWTRVGQFPKNLGDDPAGDPNAGVWPPVTTAIAPYGDGFAIPTGEVRPGVRTPRVMWAEPAEPEQQFGTANWIVLGVYMVLLVSMGFYFAGREQSPNDFFLAGNRVPWWAAGLSIFGTQLSAITYLAIPAKTFGTDWVRFLLNMGIFAIAPIVIFLYLPFFRRLKITSAYEYLERRFSLGIRLVGSASFVVFQFGRMGIVVLLPALAMSAVTGLDLTVCIVLMGVLSTIYTVLGGIEAVIWTDVVQVVVLIGGAIAALCIMAINLDGGFAQIVQEGVAHDKFRMAILSWDYRIDSLWVILLGAVFTNLVPYTSDQAVIQRYLTTPTEKQAARAVWTNAILCIPASALFFFVGTALFAFYLSHPGSLAPLEKPDQIFPWFIALEMPAGLAGLVIAGVFAAAMSSLDSSMHSIATVVTTDFVRRFRPERTEQDLLNFARVLTVALGVVGTGTALFMAQVDVESLWDFFLNIIGLLLGTLGGLFTLGIFTRRTTAVHAWIGAAASAILLLYANKCIADLNGLLFAAITVFGCVAFGYAASFVVPSKKKDTTGLTLYSLEKAPVEKTSPTPRH